LGHGSLSLTNLGFIPSGSDPFESTHKEVDQESETADNGDGTDQGRDEDSGL